MKILVGTSEICGWITLLQTELKKLGHECDTLVKSRNHFYSSSKYTYDTTKLRITENLPGRVLKSAAKRFNNSISSAYLKSFVRSASGKYDLVVYIWDSILPDFEDVRIFKEGGARIIFWFAGNEVRTFEKFSSEYDVSQWSFPEYWTREDASRKKKYVQVAEKYADLIYSVPDQAGLQTKPYYHLQIPVDLKTFDFKNNRRSTPNVLHLPSDPWKKGTDVIEKTMEELKDKVPFNFFSYRNVQHTEIPDLLQKMDIVVDEIVFHGPGVLAFEAMASGCAVATRFIEDSPSSFRPPVWNINAANIKQKLNELLLDHDLQQKLIVEGRAYVERNNEAARVVQNMMNNLLHPRTPDYLLTQAEHSIQA